MSKEEIESINKLDIDLKDIDDLDMGLEVISYNVRKNMQEFTNIIINQQSQLAQANKKYEDLQHDIKEERHLIPLTEKLEVVSILNDTREKLKESNEKLDKIKEYINKNIRHEYRNGNNNEFYLELNQNKLDGLLSIIDKDSDK